MLKKIEEVIKNFSNKKILVIGDIMLDKYSWGKVERTNPEQPAAHLVRILHETYSLGGAGNVANNITSLGAKCFLYGILGRDSAKIRTEKLCKKNKIKLKYFYGKNHTILKQRIMAHGQQVARLDFGETNLKKMDKKIEDKIINNLEKEIKRYDSVILSDYNKNIFTKDFGRRIIELANKKGIPTFVDPKPINIDFFRNCTVIFPNRKEAEEITGIKYENKEEILREMGKKLCERINSKYSIITCGSKGVFIYSSEKDRLIETKAKEVTNVTGAGDTFAAALVLGLSSKLDIFESAKLANYAAGIVVEKIGTATASQDELIKRIREDYSKDL